MYHILTSLSRGFLTFFWGNFFPQRGLLCSRHNPAFLQRTGSGSHLYSANLHTLRSGHGAKVLLALVGIHFSWSPCPLLLYPYYSTSLRVCQEVFLNFFEILFGVFWTPLDFSYIVPQVGAFVKRFFTFFEGLGLASPAALEGFPSPLDTNSIPHLTPKCNRQNAQISGV